MIAVVAFAALSVFVPSRSAAHYRVIDVNVQRGTAVIYVESEPYGGEGYRGDCNLKAYGEVGQSIAIVNGAKQEDVEVVKIEWHGDYKDGAPNWPPCPTADSIAKARADAKAKAAALGLDIERKPGPTLTKLLDKSPGLHAASIDLSDDPEGMTGRVTTVVLDGDAALAKTEESYGRMQAGRLSIDAYSVDDSNNNTAVLFALDEGNMRGEWWKFRVASPLVKKHGVDVPALRSIARPKDCAVSIASNAALIESVAVTLAYAFGTGKNAKDAAPLSLSQQERPSSIVYALPACKDAAAAIAAKLPGGATVDALTWKAAGGIVVALGDSARPK